MNKKIYCILKTIKHINDDAFVNNAIHFYDFNPEMLKIKNKGKDNKGKIIHHIIIDGSKGERGFFCTVNDVLSALYYDDLYGIEPFVEWKTKIYGDENENAWGKYFNQYNNLENADTSYGVIEEYSPQNIGAWVRNKLGGYAYKPSDGYIKSMSKIWKKYITIKDDIMYKINNDMQIIPSLDKTLGVQMRGGDMRNKFKEHPTVPNVDMYFKAIDTVLENGYDYIFMATDDVIFENDMKKRYGIRLIEYDNVLRTNNQVANFLLYENESHNAFNKGYEVLRDAITLSACDSLVAGLSQVSCGARIIKQSSGTDYKYFKQVDAGINKTGIDGATYTKALFKTIK